MFDDMVNLLIWELSDEEKELLRTDFTYKKQMSRILKEARQLQEDTCYFCGKSVTSFCNSHSVPRFVLKT